MKRTNSDTIGLFLFLTLIRIILLSISCALAVCEFVISGSADAVRGLLFKMFDFLDAVD